LNGHGKKHRVASVKQFPLILAVVTLVGCGKGKQPIKTETIGNNEKPLEKQESVGANFKPHAKINELITWVSDPSNPQNVIVERAIRAEIKKPEGKLIRENLEKLTDLRLSYTDISDAGLKEVAKLQQLRNLALNKAEITDANLKELAKLQQLSTLSLLGTKVTNEGVAQLKEALPNCYILHDFE